MASLCVACVPIVRGRTHPYWIHLPTFLSIYDYQGVLLHRMHNIHENQPGIFWGSPFRYGMGDDVLLYGIVLFLRQV